MKKTFTILIAAIAAILMMDLPVKAWADNNPDVTYDFTSSNWTVSNGTLSNGTVSFTGEGSANFKMNSGYFMMGKSGAYLNFPTYSSAVSKIVITGNNNASPNVVQNIYVGDNAVSTATTGATGTNTYNIASTSQTAGTQYTLKVTSNHNTQITKIEIYYASGGGGSSAVATTTEITVPDGFNKDLKNGTTAGTLTATVTETESGDAVDGATVNWLSNNTSVATVNASGEVTLFAEGTVKITATYEGVEDEYEDSHDDYTFTVVDSRYSHSNLIFTAACGGSGTADDGAEWTVTSDADESNFIEGSGIHYGTGSKPVQYIQLETSDIEGQISKVVVNTRDSQSAATVSVTVGGTSFSCSGSTTATNTPTDYTFTGIGSGDIVVRIARSSAINGAIYVNSVKVTYQEVAVKDPVITVPDSFVGSTTAKITCETTGATIKYNFDGGSTWNTYITDLNITETTTIYAKAVKAEDESNVVSKTTTKTYNVNIDDLTNGTITATPNVAAEGDEITLTITPDDCYQLKSGTLVVWDDEFNEISVTNNKFDMPGSDVLVSAEFELIKYAVQYSVNGVVGELEADLVNCGEDAYLYDADDLEDAGVSLPTGCSFAGWSANPASTAVVSSFYPDADATLYAVLSQSSGSSNYVKVTEDLEDWSGEYLIVYEDSENGNLALDGSLTTLDASSNTISVNINTIGGNSVIESNSTTNAASFIIASKTNGYSIKSASNLYIGHSGSKNTLNTSEYDDYTNTISVDGSASIACDNYYMRYNSTSGQERFRYYTSGQQDIQLYKKQTGTSYTRIFTDETNATANITIEGPTLITSGAVLNMGEHQLSNSDVANLIIEDGGQLICSNSVAATVKKSIDNANAKDPKNHWYTISSPVHTGSNNYVTIGASTTVNLTNNGAYDMFAYDEPTHYWLNQKSGSDASGFDKMYAGQGYMYRNSGNELSYVGNTTIGPVNIALSYTSTLDVEGLKGFNLIGNPYTHSIAKGVGKAIDNSKLSSGCYALTNSGTWTIIEDGNEIKPNQGILVEVSEAVDNFQIKDINYVAPTPDPGKYKNDNIKFIVESSEYSDAAYAWFDKGIGLTKINHRNENAPMLYIPQDNNNYAIATMSDDTKVFGLNFKAATMGQYTLSYKADGNFDYLHIIDRLTGKDIDMLLEGQFTFMANKNDSENRFIVKLGYSPDYSEGNNDIFAYQTGSEILVSGSGELQIFDVTGRKVMTTTINGAESISVPAQGVYIFRLVGNEVKTQKIVVR